ncbi:CCR4-NOT transcription complex subunit 10 isoform X1 [Canna indica]|uniref:CCR4-NOT transcription complex subunit 10 isoform X1 n=1 Tax=Canna indica TaxID=4628 RepID=A0AAQ3PZ92_9LILI|nr:CCR4-NOT transcription complex subunit 10 isoform X1 [Canna indica]
MEAKDSSAAPAAAAPLPGGKDGPVIDEGQLSDAKALAKEASFLFQSRQFQECVDVLNQLLQKKRDDAKVLHNIAVAEYFRDGCSNPRNLLDVLIKIKDQSEELAHSSESQSESGNGSGNNTVSGAKVNSSSVNQISALNSGVVYAEEFDTSVTALNIAIILYHVHEYAHALSVLETLYQNIEPIDERVALHVCLLLLDVALACQDAAKAADVIQYMEKSFGIAPAVGQGDHVSSTQQQSNQGLKIATTSNISTPDASATDSNGSGTIPENALARTLPDETLEYETLYSTLDTGSENLERPTSNDNSKLSADQAASAIDLNINLHLYKVRLLLLSRNLKAAKREIKLAMNIARFGDSSTALLLKSQLEYARGNHRKAIKLLTTSSNRSDHGMLCVFNNNMGCIYHQLGKHHTSTLFFSKALKCSMSLRSEKPLKLSTFSQDKSLYILYNCGLQYLLCGRPLVAVHCFDKTRPMFYDRPILWLRFAECCLLALEKGLLRKSGASSSEGEEIKVCAVGSGRWRELVIDDLNSTRRYLDCLGEDGLITSDGQYRLSLPFARRCLLNALYLLNNTEKVQSCSSLFRKEEDDSNKANSDSGKNLNHKNTVSGDSKASNVTSVSIPATNGDSKEIKTGMILNMTSQSSLSSYEEICRKENNMIKQAVLGNLAYVELSLGNPLKALSAARELQQLPDCSRMYLFLSHIYAAEALCYLNRSKEAAEQLSFYVSEKNEVQLPYSDEDREKWRIDKNGDGDEFNGSQNAKTDEEFQGMMFLKPEEARGALYVNLAAIFAAQGNVEQASLLVKKALSVLPDNPRAVLAAVYVDLLQGRTQDALVRLRQCRHVKFFPTHVSMSST